MNSKSTALEALVAEMLGDVGKLEASVRTLRADLVELNAISKRNIENYVSGAVGKALSEASADSFDQVASHAIELLNKVAASKNIRPKRSRLEIAEISVFLGSLVSLAFVAGMIARPYIAH